MAKKKSSNQRASSPRANSKTNIGRPEDDMLETFFMKKLRNGKLQTITAQSQTEILSYNLSTKYDAGRRRSSQKLGENQNEEKVTYIKQMFEKIDEKRFKLLWSSFVRAAEKWEFKEINSIQDFPQFLFCDECDLSYVLYETLNSDIQGLKQKTEIHNDELLFFQLLCFATRNQLSMSLIKSIEENYEKFLEMMVGLKSAVVYCGQIIKKEDKKDNDNSEAEEEGELEQNDLEIPANLRKGDIQDILHQIGKFQSNKIEKTKQIEKEETAAKKKGRPPKVNGSAKERQLLTETQFVQIAEKLMAHMIRAYAYIYSSESKKISQLKENVNSQVERILQEN